MAYRLKKIVDSCPPQDIFLVLAGKAHLTHYHGVPEVYSWLQRADGKEIDLGDQLLVCAQMMYECDLDERSDKEDDDVAERTILASEVVRGSLLGEGSGGSFEKPVADVLYVYDEEDWSEDEDDDGSDSDSDASVKRDEYNGGSTSLDDLLQDFGSFELETEEVVKVLAWNGTAWDQVGGGTSSRSARLVPPSDLSVFHFSCFCFSRYICA